jgi:hypothetical protein
MKRLLMVTAAGLALITGDANADTIKGTYSLVGNDNCTTGGPFTSDNDSIVMPNATYYMTNGGVQGFAVFSGDGTGTITIGGSWIQTRYSANVVPGFGQFTSVDHFSVYTYTGTITFTYAVTGDEFTLTETSDTNSWTAGPFLNAGATFVITGAPAVNGTIAEGNRTLQTATGIPAQETWNFGNIGLGPLTAICVRTRTFTKVKDQPAAP